MKAKTKILKVSHRNIGTISVKIDSEDQELFENSPYGIHTCGVYLNIRFDHGHGGPMASRVILKSHKMLNNSKKVFYKNGDHFDLRKTNLIQK